MTESERIVMDVLTHAAASRGPCPSNVDLCSMLPGFAAPRAASDIVERLEARGLIIVERTRSSRRVMIVATGDSTSAHIRKDGVKSLYTLSGHVSEGCTLTEAARRMGISPQRASQLWRRILDVMGEQAR